jgi:PAS domain S-box-containing protein
MPGASAGRALPFDLAPTATAVVDSAGTVIGWSQAAARLLGYGAADAVGRPLTDFLAATEPAGTDCLSADSTGTTGRVVSVRHRDGRTVSLGVETTGLTTSGGARAWSLAAIDMAQAPWWTSSNSLLGNFLSRSPYGIAVLDVDLRYIWLNETLEDMAGVSLAQRRGRTMTEVLPDLSPDLVEEQMREVLRTGKPVLNFVYRGYVPADPGREHIFSTSFTRLEDSAGRVLGVCYMGLDITERWHTRQRLSLLTESGSRIGTTLDAAATARETVDFLVPRFAEFAALDLISTVLEGQEPARPAGGRWPAMTRMACTASGVAGSAAAPQLPLDLPRLRCLADGEAVLSTDVAADGLAGLARACLPGGDPGAACHSLILVPVVARGAVLGLAVLARARGGEPFDTEDLLLAEELFSRVGISVDNARRYTREHGAALALQRRLLPGVLPPVTTLDIAYRYQPTTGQGGVGGDWFDVIPLSGCRVALVVGDVVGHGIEAAAAMGRLRTAVHTLAGMDLPPDEVLAHLDDVVLRMIDERSAGGDGDLVTAARGATCLYVVHDPVARRCSLAAAGHVAPVLVGPEGTADVVDLPPGPPLGVGTLPFEATDIDVPDGALLALYTDGLLRIGPAETDLAPPDRLTRLLAADGQSLEALCDAAIAQLPTEPHRDDIVLLLARTRALPSDHVVNWQLSADPSVVAEARANTTRTLRAWQMEDLVDTTELLVSELVTNAIRYGGDPVALRLIRHRGLICEVADGSSTSPRLRHARTTDEGGRGLFLVAQLARRWGTRYSASGKVIWAEQSLTGVDL